MTSPALEAEAARAGQACPFAYHDGRWGPLEEAVIPVGSLAMRYALSIPGLCVAVIGLENIAELEKAASVVARAQPLSADESLEITRIGLELASAPEWKTAYGTPLA